MSNLRIFRLARVAFGITTSSFLLAAVIRYHLQKNPSEFTEAISQGLYSDNIITGFPDRSWASNDSTVIDQIPEFHRQQDENVFVLGLTWRLSEDTFNVKNIASLDNKADVTLRNVLKVSAQHYDPFGWFTPISIRAKILLRSKPHNGDMRIRRS